jgi:hypothetical protein
VDSAALLAITSASLSNEILSERVEHGTSGAISGVSVGSVMADAKEATTSATGREVCFIIEL